MKIVLLGANGQLGLTFVEVCKSNSDINLHAYTRDDIDITSETQLQQVLDTVKPEFVVNAAAYTAVDLAESEPLVAYQVNETAVRNIARACKKVSAALIHISTDYVFDGENKDAYVESDATHPRGIYGKSKLKSEEAIREVLEQHIILRVSWVFSAYRNNFVKTMLRLGKELESLGIVSDQQGSPTSTKHISQVILKIIAYLKTHSHSDKPYGTYHYCDKPFTNWFAFAEKIFQEAEKYQPLMVKQVNAITTDDYPTPAKRPMNSRLNCQLIEKTFGIKQYAWEESLKQVVKEIMQK
jgi:dTDP-4-dehydrorhamnose reductase